MLFDMVLLVDRTIDDGLEKKLIVKMARKSKKDEEELNTHDMEKAWPCMLRFSKNELKHEVVLGKFLADKFYVLYSSYLKSQVNCIAFTEFFFPILKQFTSYLKKTKLPYYKKSIVHLKKTIEIHSRVVSNARKQINFNVTDVEKADAWRIPEKYGPFMTSLDTYSEVQTQEQIIDEPEIKGKKRKQKKTKIDSEEKKKRRLSLVQKKNINPDQLGKLNLDHFFD